jgi:undecaprenyl-diphosphatase
MLSAMGIPLDAAIIIWVQRLILPAPLFVAFAVFLARWMIFLNMLFAAVLFFSKKYQNRQAVIEAMWGLLVAVLIVSSVAFFVHRDRPFLTDPSQIKLLIPEPLNTSFPSGHTAASFVIAFVFLRHHRKIGYVSLAMAVLVALGRIAVGAHYPSDILGGMLAAFVSMLIVHGIHRRLITRDLRAAAKRHHHEV